jgi:predicted nucleotidyltransferase
VPHPAPVSAGGTLARGVEQVLEDLVRASQTAFGSSLVSVVLFGSAAEGQMRPTSDVNLLIVLTVFDRTQVDQVRDTLRLAHAAARVSAMFVLEAELPAAAEAFAVKFADIGRRRRVLFGSDPFASLAPSREAQAARLAQVLVNLILRLRARYALVSLRDEQLPVVIAEAAGPLRAAAASLLELEGRQVESPKAALAAVAGELGTSEAVLARVSEARETRALTPGTAGPVIFDLLELAARMRDRVARLAGHGA